MRAASLWLLPDHRKISENSTVENNFPKILEVGEVSGQAVGKCILRLLCSPGNKVCSPIH